jgi:hypothetical protein
MSSAPPGHGELDVQARAFYQEVLNTLSRARLPFLVGGAYALECFTGIQRHTKDFDLFVRREDCPGVLGALAAIGCRTEVTFPHWLGKAYRDDNFIDIIFASGNGLCRVDDAWFEHAVEAEVLGLPVGLTPPEEMIWSKAFVVERERYDGADVAHLLRACGPRLDWPRLLSRFGPHWRVLLSHLILFGYIYPAERASIPNGVMRDLLDRLRDELDSGPPRERLCRGTLLSRAQYFVDIAYWGYQDARLPPAGRMTAEEIGIWTAAVTGEKDPPQEHRSLPELSECPPPDSARL